ncbi:MAG: response regulator [Candidatus Methylomirabilales bacterium]
MEQSVRILVADDHTLVLKGLINLLSAEPGLEVIGEAETGRTTLEKTRDLMPDVVLMDVYMPDGDGIKTTRRLKAEFPYVKIIVLTIAEEEKILFEAVKAGARGYLLKKVKPQQLFDSIRGVARGEAAIAGHLAAKLLEEFARQKKEEDENTPLQQLTCREREVLQLLTLGKTNKEIADKLGIAANTVKNHLTNILEKLHLQNRVQAAAFALEQRTVSPSPANQPAR